MKSSLGERGSDTGQPPSFDRHSKRVYTLTTHYPNQGAEEVMIMTLIPVFETSVWNAWIFMSYLLLSFIPFFYIATKKESPSVKETGLSRIGKFLASSSKLLLFPLIIYSIFLLIKLGTPWYYAGLPITLIGLIAYTVVLVDWSLTPRKIQMFRGLYHYLRHPMYVAMFVFILGLGITTTSWLVLPFFVVFVAGFVIYANCEEQSCVQKWGNSYREYMKRTPRWIGKPDQAA